MSDVQLNELKNMFEDRALSEVPSVDNLLTLKLFNQMLATLGISSASEDVVCVQNMMANELKYFLFACRLLSNNHRIRHYLGGLTINNAMKLIKILKAREQALFVQGQIDPYAMVLSMGSTKHPERDFSDDFGHKFDTFALTSQIPNRGTIANFRLNRRKNPFFMAGAPDVGTSWRTIGQGNITNAGGAGLSSQTSASLPSFGGTSGGGDDDA